MDPKYFIFGAIVMSVVLIQLNQRYGSPVLAIINRWLRWMVFAFGGASIFQDMSGSSRPYWALCLAFFLGWFLLETLYNWLAIHALSLSSLPLFPRFSANQSGEEWPTHPRLLKMRDWIREQGFKQVQALRAEIGPGIYLRVSIYQDAEARVRMQVTFLPHPSGAISACCSLASNTGSGWRYVTDNLYLPFGGFYPENWRVERSPWTRSAKRLLARHQRRLAKAKETVIPWTTEPLDDLNSQQRELEQVNTELGFLFPSAQREEFGKITYEGRFRVWKEYWLLNYFGRSVRYE